MRPPELQCQMIPPEQLEVVLSLTPDLFWFRGHFTRQPVLPGVAQVDWVMYYALRFLAPGFQFHSMPNVKFQAPLLPGNRVILSLDWQEDRRVLTFRYQRDNNGALSMASSGKIRLCR